MKVNPSLDPNKVPRDSPLWKAAEGMEANFLKEMVRSMRKTVQDSPEIAEDRGYQLFRGMLDDEYAERAAKNQGIGLAELIVRQVLEQQSGGDGQVPVRDLNKSDFVKK